MEKYNNFSDLMLRHAFW